jgi:hypothetical protein
VTPRAARHRVFFASGALHLIPPPPNARGRGRGADGGGGAAGAPIGGTRGVTDVASLAAGAEIVRAALAEAAAAAAAGPGRGGAAAGGAARAWTSAAAERIAQPISERMSG